jgi:glycosyltransferase involved in cell wall biosynthesis
MADNSKSKILLITLEPISKKMAGPAIRAVELGGAVSNEFEARVFSPVELSDSDEPYTQAASNKAEIIVGGGRKRLMELAQESTAIFMQANVLKSFPALAELNKHLIVDLYDPYLFSVLVQYKDDPVQASASYRLMHQVLEKHMLAADLTVCASERQRDYWLGRFCALGRLNPEMYNFDPSLRKLIDVVPFGLPESEPTRTKPGLRARLPEIGQDDPVLVWGGGIWDWFDPLTVIKAVNIARQSIPNLRLVFMGTKSPNPKVPIMDMTMKAMKLSEELALTGKTVFFLDGWIDYDDRVNYLLDATMAISSHFDLPETRFSFRTRLLDYFWCGLPILTTEGDQLAEIIDGQGAGMALPYQDEAAWARAIEECLKNPTRLKLMSEKARAISQRFYWKDNAEPLRQFLRAPYHLPAHEKVTMPSLFERARAVYRRGGKELILKRSSELLGDILK